MDANRMMLENSLLGAVRRHPLYEGSMEQLEEKYEGKINKVKSYARCENSALCDDLTPNEKSWLKVRLDWLQAA